MTSGEWDLRALKALEEEEEAQFEAISEPARAQIPPPPTLSKLPTIEEFCGILESPPESPVLPLPPSLSKSLKLASICGAGSTINNSYPSSSSISSSLSREGSLRSHRKSHQRRSHQFNGGTPNKTPTALGPDPTADIDSAIDSILSGSAGSLVVGLGCGAETTSAVERARPNNQDKMTMMMFLSPTAPPEIVSPTVSGATTSLLCTGKLETGSDSAKDRLCRSSSISSRHMTSKKLKCNKLHSFNPNRISSSATAKSDVIDYELEDHIKHCSCSCNHMGYGNSMDYQTTGFGGLPDVTEHSNIRRSQTRQDSLANSDSADVASLQKPKKQIKTVPSKRNYCIFSCTIVTMLIFIAIVAGLVYQYLLRLPNRNSHDQRLKIVRKILQDIPLIDGHNNLAWNIRRHAHNSLDVLDRTHKDVEEASIWQRPWWSQTDIPRLKEGLVGAQVWSAFVPCEAQGLDAVQIVLEQVDIIHRFVEQHPNELTLATTTQDILTAHHSGQLASLIGIEGGHALGSSLGVLRSLHSLGARYVTLTNQCDTSWAGSSSMSMDKGLSAFGKAVIKEMNRLGMMIDLSHSSDSTVRDVLELTRAPVIFSNSVARSICNSSRNVPDDILRAVADNGGLIMISFDSQHVSCDDKSTLHDVIAHIKYIRSIAGIQHIGIGARYDGLSSPPVGLEDVSKYPNLFATLLEDSNWSDEDISMLAGKNFLRVLSSVENVRDYWKRAAIPPFEVTEPIKKSQCTYMSS